MKTRCESQLELRAAATVASEELACGDSVSLLNETIEVVSLALAEPMALGR
ncbi:MAG: hypothetical protein ACOY3P_00150 [Planctomycetota bacterium]